MDISHLKQKFIDEADVLLTNLDNLLIELEKGNNNQSVNEIFRIIHTIKGASGMFGFEKVVEITHETESLFDMVRSGKLNLTPELVEFSFSIADHIRALISDEWFVNETNIKRHQQLKKNIQTLKGTMEVPDDKVQPETGNDTDLNNIKTWNILFYPNDELIKRCINLIYTFQDLFALGEYRIYEYPFHQKEIQFWSIILVTEQPYQEIENALMFVLDYCKIIQLANFNILDPVALENRSNEIHKSMKQREIVSPTRLQSIQHIAAKNTSINNLDENREGIMPGMSRSLSTRINVEASKLDSLMYLVSELVTSKSELLISLQKKDGDKALAVAEKIEKLSKLFSENALSIRLVSLHEMLDRFKRLVRDLSKHLGKSIDFVIVGEDTELDKTIIDAIGEPIMHLIRNNIDHGIETPEARVEMGKPATGIVRFEAIKSGNNVFITISDDGKGIDLNYIYHKAIEKGFIQPGTQLSQKEMLDLIFLPGFSTAQNLTNVSGRGVGMDIVQKKIKEIRGEITVASEVGKGTSFTIKLQQTISIIDTLLVAADNITYAIPVEDVESCLLEAHENIANRQNNLIVFNNELIPFAKLSHKFQDTSLNGDNEKLIIIKKQNKRYAIIADSIIGEFQAVIKPLGKAFSKVHFLSGASLLGDGSIALLIDTDKLWYETAIN
jgi:two-component system chemotaxis sensor kinase CheA